MSSISKQSIVLLTFNIIGWHTGNCMSSWEWIFYNFILSKSRLDLVITKSYTTSCLKACFKDGGQTIELFIPTLISCLVKSSWNEACCRIDAGEILLPKLAVIMVRMIMSLTSWVKLANSIESLLLLYWSKHGVNRKSFV